MRRGFIRRESIVIGPQVGGGGKSTCRNHPNRNNDNKKITHGLIIRMIRPQG